MSLTKVFDKLGLDVLPKILDAVSNGEFRVLSTTAATVNTTDDQGFLAPVTEDQTYKFIPCVWKVRSSGGNDADERTVASQPRGVIRYKLTIPRKWKGYAVDVKTDDKIELKTHSGVDYDALTLQVLAAVNISNVVCEVTAIDTNAV